MNSLKSNFFLPGARQRFGNIESNHAAPVRGRTALVLAAEPGVRESLARVLSRTGLLVLQARNEDEAAHLASYCHDLEFLVFDSNPRTLSAGILLDFLQALHPNLHFVAMAAGECAPAVRERLEAGPIARLPQPWTEADLASVLKLAD